VFMRLLVVFFVVLGGCCAFAGPGDKRLDTSLKSQKLDDRISSSNLSRKRKEEKPELRLEGAGVKKELPDKSIAIKAATKTREAARIKKKKKRVAATR
jgi:hypothetical protein